MIEKLASWFLSGSSIGLYVVCIAVGAYGSWYVTSDHYEAKIESIRSELLTQSKKEIDDYATRLAQATSDLLDANGRLYSLSASNADLSRRLLNANNREAERSKAYSESTLRTRYSECKRLLEEGNGLLVEGSELVGKVASKSDALANLVK